MVLLLFFFVGPLVLPMLLTAKFVIHIVYINKVLSIISKKFHTLGLGFFFFFFFFSLFATFDELQRIKFYVLFVCLKFVFL